MPVGATTRANVPQSDSSEAYIGERLPSAFADWEREMHVVVEVDMPVADGIGHRACVVMSAILPSNDITASTLRMVGASNQ